MKSRVFTAGKQAKILSQREIAQVLLHIKGGRYSLRDQVMFLLSLKAGLRAKEISFLIWGMVTDASGRVGVGLCNLKCVASDFLVYNRNGSNLLPGDFHGPTNQDHYRDFRRHR